MSILRNSLLVAGLGLGLIVGPAACTVSDGVGLGGACIDDRDCDPGDACDPESGVCVTPGPAGSVVVGAECIDDSECDPGDACSDSGVCVADPYAGGSESSGQPCYDDTDCDPSTYCDVTTDTCV